MAIDIGQFVQTFFDESLEGLDVMEAGLLALSPGAADLEQINTIFRAAHSIKGGSGTFGFGEVTDFTHAMETLLDKMREGRLTVTAEAVNTLLESVDCLREMLVSLREQADIDNAQVEELRVRLLKLLEQNESNETATGKAATVEPTSPLSSPSPVAETTDWRIEFLPHAPLMHSGNDPVRIFRELATLGALTAQADWSRLPRLAEMNPEDCYLSWQLELRDAESEEAVAEVFAWVEDECDLCIEPLAGSLPPAAPEAQKSTRTDASEAAQASAEEAQQGELVLERRTTSSDRRKGERRTSAAVADSGSIRVSIDKVDAVINLVGELVTTQSMLSALGADFEMSQLDKLHEALDQLDRNTRDLQEHVMSIRMLPVSSVFSRFPRI
ncbi:MAG: Hpt domain-containing protein, partial [Candidatus Competibacteraceae bacterium]|nr:Hpt domain-containing protein [Candidatus Competibacteraceae bacterium]